MRDVYAGTSTLTIRETQHKTWGADGALTVTSEPVLDFVGGSKYTTRAEFRVEAEGADCKVCSGLRHAREPMIEYTRWSRKWHACSLRSATAAPWHAVKITASWAALPLASNAAV